MAVKHKELPDSELHEAKGFAGAPNNTVLRKEGGASQWGTIETNDITGSAVTGVKIANTTISKDKMVANTLTAAQIELVSDTTTTTTGTNQSWNTSVPSTARLPTIISFPPNSNLNIRSITVASGNYRVYYDISGGNVQLTLEAIAGT